MGFDRESSTETSFMVRATGNGGLASPSAEYTTFPVRNPSGSLSRVVTGYSNFPLQPKVSSFMFRSNRPSFGHCNSNTTPPSQRNTSSGVMAFPSSAHWRAHFDASKDTDKLVSLYIWIQLTILYGDKIYQSLTIYIFLGNIVRW